MEIITHKNLINDYINYNSWKSEESFPLIQKDEPFFKEIEDYEIVEYIFEGMKSKRSKENFDHLIYYFKEGIKNILEQDKKIKYIFAIEKSSSPISRIKSYKGLIDKNEVIGGDYIEKEVLLNENESRIAFVIRLNESNFDYLTKFIFDYTNCFIISSESNYINEFFIEKTLSLFNINGWTHINYLNIMLQFCFKDDFIYRIGGNDGEEYWSLQLIKKK